MPEWTLSVERLAFSECGFQANFVVDYSFYAIHSFYHAVDWFFLITLNAQRLTLHHKSSLVEIIHTPQNLQLHIKRFLPFWEGFEFVHGDIEFVEEDDIARIQVGGDQREYI